MVDTKYVSISQQVYDKLASFGSLVSDRCIVTGGHFMLDVDQKPQMNPGTELSFKIAAEVYARTSETKKAVGLGLLFNNIGATCDENACRIGEKPGQFVLPSEYAGIMEEMSIGSGQMIVFLEKHLRNRGKKEFNKRVRTLEGIQENEEGWWLKNDNSKKFILTRRAQTDPYGTPACPLIMAAYALEQERRGFEVSLNYWYIDSDNFKNIPNHFMIEKGREVAKMFGSKIKIMNVYFTREKVITSF